MQIYPWQTDPQLGIDTFNTATPNLAHLMADLYIYYIYIYIYIYILYIYIYIYI